jgi:hypothetical protein
MVEQKCGGIGQTVTMYDHKLNRVSVALQVDLL